MIPSIAAPLRTISRWPEDPNLTMTHLCCDPLHTFHYVMLTPPVPCAFILLSHTARVCISRLNVVIAVSHLPLWLWCTTRPVQVIDAMRTARTDGAAACTPPSICRACERLSVPCAAYAMSAAPTSAFRLSTQLPPPLGAWPKTGPNGFGGATWESLLSDQNASSIGKVSSRR